MPSKESGEPGLDGGDSTAEQLQLLPRMYVSHAAAAGFLLALLALRMEALPAPQNLPGSPSGLDRELAELLAAASGPGSGSARGGSRQQRQQHRSKVSSSSSSRLLRDLRTDAKQARLRWSRGDITDPLAGGPGVGLRRRKGKGKGKGKDKGQGCFGLPLDRIGARSGLGC